MIKFYKDLEFLPPESLRGHPQNPKTHTDEQVKHIAASIERFGFTQPILIDEDNVIIIGHGRHLAALSLRNEQWFAVKFRTIPVLRVTGFSEAQKKALMLADNSIGSETGYDAEALTKQIESLAAEWSALGIIPPEESEKEKKSERDSDPVDENREAFDNADEKQITFFFLPEEYNRVTKIIDSAMEKLGCDSKSQLLLRLISEYEESSD